MTVALSPSAARRIASALDGMAFPSDGLEHGYVSMLRKTGHASMPVDLQRVIDAVRAGTLAPTAVVFRGLEFDKVASSPAPVRTHAT